MRKNNVMKEWKDVLNSEEIKQQLKKIGEFLKQEINEKKIICPDKKNIFKSLEITKYSNVSVVILGQDPYPNFKKADGLAFSVPNNVIYPQSLQNIFKELKNNYNNVCINTGSLDKWAKQGVLLLNVILTVEEHKPKSHSNIGWEKFTDQIIQTIAKNKKNIVFVLLGKDAQNKEYLIDKKKHFIIKTSHPSPLSAHYGFLGSNIFKKINSYLKKINKKQILWDT